MMTYSSADALLRVLRRHVPDATEHIAPFLPRLWYAWADGHSFIWVSNQEKQQLENTTPLVSYDGSAPLVLNGNKLFLARHWQLERDLAREIQRLSTPFQENELPHFPQAAKSLSDWFVGDLSQDQQAAAALTLLNRFTLISGGPGTGKTTTVAKLLALLCQGQTALPRIALVAPTGKAAARMSSALKNAAQHINGLPEHITLFLQNLNGQTIHRLLQLRPPQMTPVFHAQHRLPLDVLVADEASMLDNYLFWQLLCALPNRCRVILLGDEHQLPPVGAGAVLNVLARHRPDLPEHTATQLRHLLPNGWHDSVLSAQRAHLHISHRFGENSPIGCLARAVVAGDGDMAWQQFSVFPEALLVRQGTAEQQATALYQAHRDYWQAIDNHDIHAAFEQHNKIMVLAATRNDAAAFNLAYVKRLQQHGRARADAPWFSGQLLMITRNDPATQLFNGDVGIVLPREGTPVAWFAHTQNDLRYVPLSRLPAHETAFAITVHKSQGSEYEQVWLLAPQASESLDAFSRALLYTAITRAKQQFCYWGESNAFYHACQNNTLRRSDLAKWLSAN